MGVSNNVIAALNFIALLCSIPIIASGVWLASRAENACVHWLRWPVVFAGAAVLLVALAGFVGAYWNKHGLLALYLFSMAALISTLLVLLILSFIVFRPDGAVVVPSRAYREYRLDGFSEWLRDHVTGPDNWDNIRACLADSDFCAKLNDRYISAEQFFAADLSPLQSGCCKPPTICGYQYVNPTMWINPVNPIGDPDCAIWNNDQSQLCYNCDSCKAGLLGNLRKEWRKVNAILIVALVVLIGVYMIACSAFRNAQKGLIKK
ncbi:hypothetical protein NMG60_11021975 [Bertholletia excelsa]